MASWRFADATAFSFSEKKANRSLQRGEQIASAAMCQQK
jgi:hypothetical protein